MKLVDPTLRPISGSGNPYANSYIQFFEYGTSTPTSVYADYACTQSIGDTVYSDGEGLFPDIFYNQAITLTLRDSLDVIQWTKSFNVTSSVNTDDITDGAVTETKVADGAISLNKLVTLGNAKIITSNGTANQQVSISGDATMANTGALSISNNAITSGKIADSAVTTAKISDQNVTESKLSASLQSKVNYAKNEIYSGTVYWNGSSMVISGAQMSGFTASRSGAGRYTITHNFGSDNYTFISTPEGTNNIVNVTSRGTNSVSFRIVGSISVDDRDAICYVTIARF